jgi:uncharacterized protein
MRSPNRLRTPRTPRLCPRFLGFWGLAVLAACSRTPPEPTPAATTAEVKKPPSETTTTSRCITRLPAAAPPIPSAAPAAKCPPDPEAASPPKMASAEVSFPEATSGAFKIDVELAKNPHDVERGLMYRRTMSDERGMLFTLDGRREHTFWMHNTCLPLDMMFIDDDGVIVGIVEGAAPLSDTTRSVGCPSVFVLEVNAGWTRKRGVAPGQKVAIPFAAR